MKKIKIYLFVLLCFIPFLRIRALEVNQQGYINAQNVLFYSKPNYQGNKVLNTLDTGDQIKLLDTSLVPSADSNRCKSGFYHISFYWESYNKKNYEGYVCADYVQMEVDVDKYEKEFAEAGFPESYFEKLALLKDQHPNWKFTAYKTGLDWNNSVNAESVVGISYIQVTNLNEGAKYISLDPGSYDPITKSYMVREGSNWYAANNKTVAYYLDPRNFINEREIFMFENLGYNSNYQTINVVQKVLNNTALYDYSDNYVEAATYNGNNVSPIFLAARSRQEVVLPDGNLSGSANGSTFKDKVVYNFYNIGAYSSGCTIDGEHVSDAVLCGRQYAYNRGWYDARTAILEGAKFIAEGYINRKQNTLYFQKFNVTSNVDGNYSHQYMTNIAAPRSEAIQTYQAYANIEGLLNEAIEFLIPVYENMPEQISNLPTSVDQDKKNELDNNVNKDPNAGTPVVDIIHNAGYTYNNGYISSISIGTSAQAFISNIKGISSQAEVIITSTDTSGNTKNLTDGTALGTGDIVTITSGDDSIKLRVVIYGDVNGDGIVSAVDYVKIKNYIMSSGSLNGSYKIAADVNKDGSISAVDYVNVKNYIMGKDSVLR